jgi:hypothetical protein
LVLFDMLDWQHADSLFCELNELKGLLNENWNYTLTP